MSKEELNQYKYVFFYYLVPLDPTFRSQLLFAQLSKSGKATQTQLETYSILKTRI